MDKEQADFDDSEAENPDFNDTEDNEVTDLSGGEPVQSEEEEMSFENKGGQSYDDYDDDEDSAAEEDDDDSDANFTESDDEEVMSDISHINDYSDEIDQEDEESGNIITLLPLPKIDNKIAHEKLFYLKLRIFYLQQRNI